MATYPIKMLKDEQGTPFVPLTSTVAVRDENGQTVEQIVANKLSPTNIKEGENIVVSVSGNDVTITADVPDTTVLIDNLNQTTAGVGALDARQGKVLYDTLQEQRVPSGGNAGQVLKKKTNTDNDLEWGDAADPNAISGDGSIKKIIEISYEDYQALQTIDPDTEYHIIESGSTGSIEYEIRRIIREMDEAKHPIGSLEFNTSGTNPSVYLGFGTWELWGAGKVPIGVDSSDSSIDDADKTVGSKTKSYTPAGTNSGGNVQGTAITKAQLPNYTLYNTTHKHVLSPTSFVNNGQFINAGYGESNAGSSGCWTGDNQFALAAARGVNGVTFPAVITSNNLMHTLNTTDSTIKVDSGGSGQTHTHSFTQPTFTGTQANINVVQPSIACYMWKRTA